MAGKKGVLAGWELSAAGTPFGPPKERGGEAEAAALARAEERETAARAREKDRGGRGKGEELNEKGRERRGKFLAPRGATSCHRGLIAAAGVLRIRFLLSTAVSVDPSFPFWNLGARGPAGALFHPLHQAAASQAQPRRNGWVLLLLGNGRATPKKKKAMAERAHVCTIGPSPVLQCF